MRLRPGARGATTLQYALIIGFIIVIVVGAGLSMGHSVGGSTSTVTAALGGNPVYQSDYQAYQQAGGSTAGSFQNFAKNPGKTYENVVLSDHPMAFYRLNQASGAIAADSSGNGYDASFNQPSLILINYAQNPSFEGGTGHLDLSPAPAGTAIDTTTAAVGSSSLLLPTTAAWQKVMQPTADAMAVSTNTQICASAWVKAGVSGMQMEVAGLQLLDSTHTPLASPWRGPYTQANVPLTWTRYATCYTVTASDVTAGAAYVRMFTGVSNVAYGNMWTDGWVLENTWYETPYIDGATGIWGSWSGAANASNSYANTLLYNQTSIVATEPAGIRYSSGGIVAPSQVNPYSGDFTIEVWISPDSLNGTNANNFGVILRHESYATWGYRFGLWNGSPRFWTQEDGGNINLSGPALTLGSPHQLVLTVTGSTVTMFVDGVQVAQATGTFVRPATGGMEIEGLEYPLYATVQDVAIYPAVLPSTRISNHYHTGCGC